MFFFNCYHEKTKQRGNNQLIVGKLFVNGNEYDDDDVDCYCVIHNH